MNTTKASLLRRPENALQQLSAKCAELGVQRGENAADFRTRNPKAADQLAAFIRENHSALVRCVTDKMVRS